MSGEKEDAQLVDKLIPRKALARGSVPGGHDRAGNIIRTRMSVDQRAEMRPDPGAGGQHAGLLRNARPGGIRNQPRNPHLRNITFEDNEIVEHIPGDTHIQRHRKDRPADDVGRQMAHRQIERQGLAGGRELIEARFLIGDRLAHGLEGNRQAHVRESRIDHGALPPPGLSVRHEDRFTDQRLERADHEVTLRKDAVLVFENLPDNRRIVEQDDRPARVAERACGDAIGRGRKQRQKIALPLPERPGQRGDRPEGARARGINRRALLLRHSPLSSAVSPATD